MPIKGLIFDKDGTLFDFQATWSVFAREMIIQEANGDDRIRHSLSETLGFDFENNRFHADSLVIAETVEVVATAVLSVLPHLDKDALIARMNAAASTVPQIEAVPLRELFTKLKSMGYTLGIATNDAEVSARAHLDGFNIAQFFDFVAGYDSGFGGKPAPGQLLAFCQKSELDPNECAMVGDSLHDLESGRAAGMTTVGVLTGPATADDLAPLADIVFPTIAELPNWLANLD